MPGAIAPLIQGEYAPLATGYGARQPNPFEGVPGSTSFGGLLNMAAAPYLYRAFGQVGMVPMGVGHDQNYYDRLMQQQFSMSQMRAIQQAAESDRAAFQQTLRGLAAVTGTPYGGAQRQAAHSLSGAMVTASPFLAMMAPDLLDQMGGTRGSAAVMAQRLMLAGRYRLDPVTGRMGLSDDSAGDLSRRLFQQLYSGNNVSQMAGVSAGQVGSLVDELQRRGMLPTAATQGGYGGFRSDDIRSSVFRAVEELRQTNPEALRQGAIRGVNRDLRPAGSTQKLTDEDFRGLALDPNIADRLRAFDANRLTRTIRAYTSAVGAIRDIFGDMGRPNAPMAELMSGLEKLTMGSLHQMAPERVAATARMTYNLAKQTGVSLENAMMIQDHAAARAQALGLPSIFAVQATQHSLAFGGAYRAQGHAGVPAWGAYNADQITQLNANLHTQASDSPMANRMAVALRLAQMSGGFQDGSDAARYVMAAQAGQDQWGNGRSMLLSNDEFMRMMTGARARNGQPISFSQNDIVNMLGQRHNNQEIIAQHGLGSIVRRLQGTGELQPFIAAQLSMTLAGRLQEQLIRNGVSPETARARAAEAAMRVSRESVSQAFRMSTEQFNNPAEHNRIMGQILERQLQAGGFGGLLPTDAAERARFLEQTSGLFVGQTNTAIRHSIYSAHGDYGNVHRMYNPATLDGQMRQELQSRIRGQLQDAMMPLGPGSMLRRGFDALQNVRPGDNDAALQVVGQALGGVRQEDLNGAIMPHYQALRDVHDRFMEAERAIMAEVDPTKRANLMARIPGLRAELRAAAERLTNVSRQYGNFTTGGTSPADFARGLVNATGLVDARNDLAGLRYGVGDAVSAAEIAAFKASPGNSALSDGEARAAIRRRRREMPLRPDSLTIEDTIRATRNVNGFTAEDARELANMRQRAARLGINVPRNNVNPRAEMAAINVAIGSQALSVFDVSDADRAELIAHHGNIPDEQVAAYQETYGGTEAAARNAIATRRVLEGRQNLHRTRQREFWSSAGGGAFRETVEATLSSALGTGAGLLNDPHSVNRYGTLAIEYGTTLNQGANRLQVLARMYAGGDVARLLNGDYTIDWRSPTARATVAGIHAEITEITNNQRSIFNNLNQTRGTPGRHFRAGDNEEAMALLGLKPADLAALTAGAGTGNMGAAAMLARYNQTVADIRHARTVPIGQEGVAANREVFARLRPLQESLRQRSQAADARNSVELARDLIRAYGFDVPAGELTGTQAQIAGLLNVPIGRVFAQTALQGLGRLRSRAGLGNQTSDLAGVDAMSREYREIMADPNETSRQQRIRAFQARYRFASQGGTLTPEGMRDWNVFSGDVAFQNAFGLNNRIDSDASLRTIIENFSNIDTNRPLSGGHGQFPTRMEMSGTVNVNLTDRTIDMAGAYGGARDFTVPSA